MYSPALYCGPGNNDINNMLYFRYKSEGNAADLQKLIQMIRPFSKLLSKAKAAKLVRGLVDM